MLDDLIRPLAERLDPLLTVIDVGCRDGVDPTWLPLLPHLRAYGFEADPAESARLNREHSQPQLRFVPVALGATPGPAELHVTQDPNCSSLYPPDTTIAARYRALEVIAPVGKQTVTVDTLDLWADRERPGEVSFLKLDTQGSELDVLRGATDTLRTVVALRTEVEFNQLYEGQPLFGDIDRFMREQGFVLWRLLNLTHCTLNSHDPGAGFRDWQMFTATPQDAYAAEIAAGAGRLFWGEAFYVREELATGQRPDDPARAALVLATLGFHDLAAVCL